jgi:hypothetical protein
LVVFLLFNQLDLVVTVLPLSIVKQLNFKISTTRDTGCQSCSLDW